MQASIETKKGNIIEAESATQVTIRVGDRRFALTETDRGSLRIEEIEGLAWFVEKKQDGSALLTPIKEREGTWPELTGCMALIEESGTNPQKSGQIEEDRIWTGGWGQPGGIEYGFSEISSASTVLSASSFADHERSWTK